MNGGSTELQPKIDRLLTSKGINVSFEPSIFAPKQEGYMIVEYDPRSADSSIREMKIYLQLPNISPRNSVVEVVIENRKN
jgi:hypothetical protein